MLTLKYYGIEGTGKNVTEAKADAGRKITKTLEADFTPYMVEYKGLFLFVWREINGYCHKVVTPMHGRYTEGSVFGCSSSETDKKEVIKRGRRHLADCVEGLTAGEAEQFFSKDLEGFSDWQRKQRFNVELNRLISEGKSRTEAHEMACNSRY